jgi:hypothetical protein
MQSADLLLYQANKAEIVSNPPQLNHTIFCLVGRDVASYVSTATAFSPHTCFILLGLLPFARNRNSVISITKSRDERHLPFEGLQRRWPWR